METTAFILKLSSPLTVFCIFGLWACVGDGLKARPWPPTYSLVIDPGHGSATARRKDDRWDPISREYLSFSNYGSQYKNHHEHEIVLALAKKLKYYLDLTRTSWGWKRFQWYLSQFSNSKKTARRVLFLTHLSRKNSWQALGLSKKHLRVNEPYRLFDYPDLYRKGRTRLGRISRINHWRPYLVLSLHMTSAGSGHKGGMAAVLVPGYKTLNLLRQISLGQKSRTRFHSSPWEPHWLISRSGWSRFQSAWSDAWVYFHGYNTKKDTLRRSSRKYYRGIRHNMVTWRYADPSGWVARARKDLPAYSREHRRFRPEGPFWERERAEPEQWRREGGPLKFGGDNYYAANELLRYVQLGTRLLDPQTRNAGSIGPIQPPYVSTYALPIYVNAVTAYLELGYINLKQDRQLMIRKRDKVALSLAVGIYSLFQGLSGLKQLRGIPDNIRPRGQSIHWRRYVTWKKGNYFHRVVRY